MLRTIAVLFEAALKQDEKPCARIDRIDMMSNPVKRFTSFMLLIMLLQNLTNYVFIRGFIIIDYVDG